MERDCKSKLGKSSLQTRTIGGEKLVKLNTSNFVNGSYTLQLIDNKGNCIKTEKLIVQQP